MASYAVYVVPDAHRQSANRLFAMVLGDDILGSNNLGQPACGASEPVPTYEDEATHWLGGRPVDAEWLATFQNLSTDLPSPDGGWPLVVGGNTVLTEQEAQDAAGALYINVNTGEDAASLPQQNLNTVCAALSIRRCDVEE